MVILVSTSNSPLVRPIVPVTAKSIVSPSLASASTWRNEPGPLSLVLVTVMVLACSATPLAKKKMTTIANLMLGLLLILILASTCRVESTNHLSLITSHFSSMAASGESAESDAALGLLWAWQ